MSKKARASTFMFLSAIYFAVTHALVKFMSDIPFYELVFFRAMVSFVMCWVSLSLLKIPKWGVDKKNLILRGLFGTVALNLYFYSLQTLPLATAVTLQYLSPIFTVLVSGFVLQEGAKLLQWIFFVGAFCGVLILKGFDARIEMIPLILAVTASLFSGIAYTWVRKLGKTDHPLVVVMYFPLVTIPVVGPWALSHWIWPRGWQWLGVLAIGFFTQLAQVNMTKAFQMEKASEVGLIKYFGVVIAVFVGWLIFNEPLTWGAIIGISVILGCIILGSKLPKSSLFKMERYFRTKS